MVRRIIDTLEAEDFGPLGLDPLHVIDLGKPGAMARAAEISSATQAIVLGLDRKGVLPIIDPAPFDVLLTTAPHPPRPWTGVEATRWDARLTAIRAIVGAAPFAATIARRVLRMGESLAFDDALHLESLAYSTLLGGAEFRRWRSGRQSAERQDGGASPESGAFVEVTREDDVMTIAMARPKARNAICAGMRDALFEALAAALDDPSAPRVRLRGQGACFSTGGELAEFGTADDLARAHAIRSARSGAALLHRLSKRAEALLHGACIGSGIEIPAAAARRVGRRDAFFQLPELRMGLIPGAGGTVTLPRAIGRHRTASLLFSARRIDAATARDWGLLTDLVP